MALLVTPPTVEPMTPADVRLRLKYPRTDQDAAIADWIASARNVLERYVERGIMTQTWELQTRRDAGSSASSGSVAALASGDATESHVDHFSHNLTTYRAKGPRLASTTFDPAAFGAIDLPWAAPLQTIESVTDDQGDVPVDAYAVDRTVEPARLFWLDASRPSGVAVIRYRVGYGDTPQDVPANLRQVVYSLVQQYFLFRSGPPPESALEQTLCHADGYRVRTFA